MAEMEVSLVLRGKTKIYNLMEMNNNSYNEANYHVSNNKHCLKDITMNKITA